MVDEGSDHEETFWAHDDTLDDSVLENLASEDDEDAALVLQFEDAVAEVVQSDGELCALYSSYQDARKRLSEKVRFRGFWKVRGSEKGKSIRVQRFQRSGWFQTVVGQSHSLLVLQDMP